MKIKFVGRRSSYIKRKIKTDFIFNENLNKRIISKMKITHCSLLITYKNDGSPKWKSRGGLQNRCEN